MFMKKAIAYYRVSTQRQGVSGLGLEAQRAAVKLYAGKNNYLIEGSYTEVETGTNKRRRVEIYKAIDDCRRQHATLLIAKLDRLARSVAFTSALMDAGVEFVAVDMPEANSLTIHIMAALAEYESKMISQRTKDALAAAKARGVKLGNPQNMTAAAQRKSVRSKIATARDAYRPVYGYISLLREQGTSYRLIARRLNDEGHMTRTGAEFSPMTVYRIVQRGNGELHADQNG